MLLFVVMVSGAACKKKRALPGHRVDVLQFNSFSLAVPAGWNQVDEPEMVKQAGPNGRVLSPSVLPAGFTPSVLIQQLELPADGIAFMRGATAEACAAGIQKPMADQTKSTPGPSKTWDHGSFHGCDIEVVSPTDRQATRQISFTDGTITVSLVCNRDKGGAPAVDAACEAMARAVVAR